MGYHLVMNRKLDLDGLRRDSAAGLRPRHGFAMLAERLGATVHAPDTSTITLRDRLHSRLMGGGPEYWSMARRLIAELNSGDVIYCTGEDVALPIAWESGGSRNRPKLALFAHNLDRPRAKVLLKLFGLAGRLDLVITNIRSQIAFLRDFAKIPESRLHLIQDQTDVKFFTPGPPSADKARPIIMSVGLEKRDYRTLAEATHDLGADVRISGFSSDAAAQARAFPETLPANMSQRFYEWPELVQLYRDADVVAISLFECKYSAGITTLMEGLASRRPVVATRTEGLSDYLDPETVLITRPGDSKGLRQAILSLLENPSKAEALANHGHEIGRVRHDSDRFTEEIAGLVEGLAEHKPALAGGN